MSRVLLSCLARLNSDEIEFLAALRKQLKAKGHELLLLSPYDYSEYDGAVIPLPLRWENWVHRFHFDPQITSEALGLLDTNLWLRRIEHFSGSLDGAADCTPLLQSLATVSLTILRVVDPGLFISWNPTDPTTGILHELANKTQIPIFALERGMLPGTLNADPDRYGIYDSVSTKSLEQLTLETDLERLKNMGARFLKEAFAKPFSRYAQNQTGLLRKAESGRWKDLHPKVLVLGNYDPACAFSPGDPIQQAAFPGFDSGFDLARKVARSHKGLTIFKPHPVMTRRISSYDARGVTNLMVGTGAPEEYINWADVVVTYGSTLEFAALAFKKPVVLSAKSALYGKGITFEALLADQLPEAIKMAQARDDFPSRLERFNILVGYLLSEYLMRVDSPIERSNSSMSWSKSIGQIIKQTKSALPTDMLHNSLVKPPGLRELLSQLAHSKLPKTTSRAKRAVDVFFGK